MNTFQKVKETEFPYSLFPEELVENVRFKERNRKITESHDYESNIKDSLDSNLATNQNEAYFNLTTNLVAEPWNKKDRLSGRVLKVEENFVYCEYIIYYNYKKFYKERRFPIILFQHLPTIEEGLCIKIIICQKPGATKTEIYDGKGLGIEKEFEDQDIWKELEDFQMDEPPSPSS